MPHVVSKLCHVKAIPNGKARGFDPLNEGTDRLFLIRQGKKISAYRNLCPHQDATLPWRKDEYLNADGRIMCSSHGALFDPDSGECLQGPALGKSLEPIDLNIDEDGIIYAHLNIEEESNEQ